MDNANNEAIVVPNSFEEEIEKALEALKTGNTKTFLRISRGIPKEVKEEINFAASLTKLEEKQEETDEVKKKTEEEEWKKMTLHDAMVYIFSKYEETLALFTLKDWYHCVAGTSMKSSNIHAFGSKRNKNKSFGSYLHSVLNKKYITDVNERDVLDYIKTLKSIDTVIPDTKAKYLLGAKHVFSYISKYIFDKNHADPFKKTPKVNFNVIVDRETGEIRPHPSLIRYMRTQKFPKEAYIDNILTVFWYYLEKKRTGKNPVTGIHLDSLNLLLSVLFYQMVVKRLNELRVLECYSKDKYEKHSGIYCKETAVKTFPDLFTHKDFEDFTVNERFIIVRRKPTTGSKIEWCAAYIPQIILHLLMEQQHYFDQRVKKKHYGHGLTDLEKIPEFVFPSMRAKYSKPLSHQGMMRRFRVAYRMSERSYPITSHSIRDLVDSKWGLFGLTKEESENCLAHTVYELQSADLKQNNDEIEIKFFKLSTSRKAYDKDVLLRQIHSTKKWQEAFLDTEIEIGENKIKIKPFKELVRYLETRENLVPTNFNKEQRIEWLKRKKSKKTLMDYAILELIEYTEGSEIDIDEIETSLRKRLLTENLDKMKGNDAWRSVLSRLVSTNILKRETYSVRDPQKKVSKYFPFSIKRYWLNPMEKWTLKIKRNKLLEMQNELFSENESNEMRKIETELAANKKRLEAYEKRIEKFVLPKLRDNYQ